MKTFTTTLLGLTLVLFLTGCQIGLPAKDNGLYVGPTMKINDDYRHLVINGKTVELVKKTGKVSANVLIDNNRLIPLDSKVSALNFDGGKLVYIDNRNGKQMVVYDGYGYGDTPLSDDFQFKTIANGSPVFVLNGDKGARFLQYKGRKIGPYKDFEVIVPYNGTVAFQAVDMNGKTGIFDGATFNTDYDDVLSLVNVGEKLAYIGWKRAADRSSKGGESFVVWGDAIIASSKDPNIKLLKPFDVGENLAYFTNDLTAKKMWLMNAQGGALSDEYDLIYDARTINGKLSVVGLKGDKLTLNYGGKVSAMNKKAATPFGNLIGVGGTIALVCTMPEVNGYYVMLPGSGKFADFEDSQKTLFFGPFTSVTKVLWIGGRLAVLGHKDGQGGLFYQNGTSNAIPVQNMSDPGGTTYSGAFKMLKVNDVAVDGERIAVVGDAEIQATRMVIVEDGKEVDTKFQNVESLVRVGDSYAFIALGDGGMRYLVNGSAQYGPYTHINTAVTKNSLSFAGQDKDGIWHIFTNGAWLKDTYHYVSNFYAPGDRLFFIADKSGGDANIIYFNGKIYGNDEKYFSVKIPFINGKYTGVTDDDNVIFIANVEGKNDPRPLVVYYKGVKHAIDKEYEIIRDVAVINGTPAFIAGKYIYEGYDPTGAKWVIFHDGKELFAQYDYIDQLIEVGGKMVFTAARGGRYYVVEDGKEIGDYDLLYRDFVAGPGKGDQSGLYKIANDAYGYDAEVKGTRWFFFKGQKFGPYDTIEQNYDDPAKFIFTNGKNRFEGQYGGGKFEVK